LHEIDHDDYITMKRNEYLRQQTLPQATDTDRAIFTTPGTNSFGRAANASATSK
jgi:hypothetical protein